MASVDGGASAATGPFTKQLTPAGAGVTPSSAQSFSLGSSSSFSLAEAVDYGVSVAFIESTVLPTPAGGGGAPPDATSPTVGNFSPPEGTEVDRTEPLFFDVTDDSGDFRRVLVAVTLDDGVELAHDGDVFTQRYVALSERQPLETSAVVTGTVEAPFVLADGETLIAVIDGGSPQTVTFHTSDFDDIAVAQAVEVCAVITAALAAGTGVPTSDRAVSVHANSVGLTSTIEITGGTARAALGLPTGQVAGAAGWHFRLQRTDGWPSSPTITAYAFDKAGNES